jgi:hypothetical protein
MAKIADWLGLGRKPGEIEPPDWLTTDLPGEPEAASETIRRNLPATLAQYKADEDRHALLESVYEKVRRILSPIELQLEAAPRPLPAELRPLAVAADGLLKAVAAGYFGIVSDARTRNLRAAESSVIPLAVQRSMECMTRRQQLAFRASTPPSANTWQLIHETYAYARHQGLTGFSSGGCSIEHEYLFALLLSWSDPGKFAREEFPELLDCLIHYALLAQIRLIRSDSSPIEAHAPIFLILDSDPHSGRRMDKPVRSVQGRAAWIVDCRPLAAAIEKSIGEREKGSLPSPDEPPSPIAMLRAVVAHLREFPVSRATRRTAKPDQPGE